MRAILLTGAAVLTLGTFGSMSVTTANAGALWVSKNAVVACGLAAIFTGPQTNCEANIITGGSNPNNHSVQKVKQDNKFVLWAPSAYIDQNNIGVNVINRDDGNKQKVDQGNTILGGGFGILQTNVGVNAVEDGEWNKQKVEQDNTAKGYNVGLTQTNAGLNYVDEGNGNTQKMEQSNYAKNAYDVDQTNIGVNYVGNGNGNYQEVEQSNTAIGGEYLAH